MKLLYILAISFALTGCAINAKKPDAILTEKVVYIDPRVLISCSDLIVPEEPVTFDSLLTSSIANAELYLDCRIKQENSIKLLKEFANIKEKP